MDFEIIVWNWPNELLVKYMFLIGKDLLHIVVLWR